MKMETQIRLADIYRSFDSGMRALHDLSIAIQDSLGDNEWKAVELSYQEAFSLFEDYDPVEVQTIMDRLIRIDIEDETLDLRKVWEAVNVPPDDIIRLENDREVFGKEIQNGLREFAKQNPEKANKFFRAYLKTLRAEPFKSEVSRHGLLLSAVSQFELLLLHLLRAYFVYHDHDTVLSEDCEIEELDDLVSQKIGKKLKRLSIFDKLDLIVSKFPLNDGFSRTTLKEIVERRNVFAHRGGRADVIYAQCNSKVQVGDKLRISQHYIRYAIEYLHLWGLVLCIKIWSKLGDSDQNEAGKSISSTAMQLIRDKRYGFCDLVCQQIHENIQFQSQNSKDILMINYAICAEKLADKERMIKILSQVRQFPRKTERSLKKMSNQEPFLYVIPMACNALMGKKQYAMELLERAANSNQVSFLDLDYWVIFDYLATEPGFQHIREELESKVTVA